MKAIFISYRREDAEGQAGRLFDDLTRHFGEDTVFMDVAGIEPGRDFRRVIDEHVASCGVLLAMIGKSWIDAADESGRRRLDDPMDFVRLETASALKRDIPVVPVLVHGARIPRADQLPTDLADLAYRNGVELTHARWDSDVQLLIKALNPYVESQKRNASPADITSAAPAPGITSTAGTVSPSGASRATGAGSVTPAQPAKRSLPIIVAGSVAALIISIGGYAWYQMSTQRAEVMRQAALLEEAKEKLAAEQLESKKRAEEKAAEAEEKKRTEARAAADAEEAKKLAREKATAAEAEAKRRAQEQAIAAQAEAKKLAREKAIAAEAEAKRRAQEQAIAAEAEAKRLAQQRANEQELETKRLAEQRSTAPPRAPPRRVPWVSYNFPPPNGGLVVYIIMKDGNPACASYDAARCLWGVTYDRIDFGRVKLLICGDAHRARWGVTGYEDPKHWCSMARRVKGNPT